MSIADVQAFPDYEFMDVGEYKPLRDPLVTISRDAWDDIHKYIARLEEENEQLKEELYGSDDS